MPSTFFEDFSEAPAPEPQSVYPIAPMEEDQEDIDARNSFDDGYKEGWVDAQAAQKAEQDKLTADVATALQEASFAYFEARQHVFKSMKPLLEAITGKFISDIARDNVVSMIVEHVEKLSQQADPPLCILCAPDIAEPLENVVSKAVSFAVDIKVEPTLSGAQALIRFSDGETEVDLDQLLENIRGEIKNFYALTNEKEAVNV